MIIYKGKKKRYLHDLVKYENYIILSIKYYYSRAVIER